MKILISSVVDVNKTPHNRLHQFIKYLSKNNDITVLCINDWWKSKQTDATLYTQNMVNSFGNVEVVYITEKKLSPIIQEVFSFFAIDKIKNINSFDVHLNYNSLVLGYAVSKKARSNVYDIADDLPEMIRTSPQIPFFMKSIGAMFGSAMLKANISNCNKITYITDSLKSDYAFPPSKSVHVPNGVDTALFKKYYSDELKSTFGSDNSFIIGYVGVLREWVDMEPVFGALQKISQEINIKMLIVGEEGQLNVNKRLVERYGISDKVIFAGTVPYVEVPKYISCMDVCLIPFKKDAVSKNSLPLKLFEYMACEKPVISTRLPGVIDSVGERILYASNSDEFYENILYLYKNDSVRRKLGREGREFVKSNYDWSVICSKIEKVLEESL